MNGTCVRVREILPLPVVQLATDYCYDAELIAAVVARRSSLPPSMEIHRINNLLQNYMAFSGYYGADIPVQSEKVRLITVVFEEWLILKLV